MFSCRIQAKQVEHAFLIFILNHYKLMKFNIFEADYIKTDRNQQAGKVFNDLAFYEKSFSNGKYVYYYDLNRTLPEK